MRRLTTSVPMTSEVYFGPMTTGWSVDESAAMHYVKEAQRFVQETRKENFVMHICKCHYCRSHYPASLEIGYACPACGAYEFDIERTINNSEVTRR